MSSKRIGDQSEFGVSADGAMIVDSGELKAPTLHPERVAEKKHPSTGARAKVPGASERGSEHTSRPSGRIPRNQSTHQCALRYRGEHTGLEEIRPTHCPELPDRNQQSSGGSAGEETPSASGTRAREESSQRGLKPKVQGEAKNARQPREADGEHGEKPAPPASNININMNKHIKTLLKE